MPTLFPIYIPLDPAAVINDPLPIEKLSPTSTNSGNPIPLLCLNSGELPHFFNFDVQYFLRKACLLT